MRSWSIDDEDDDIEVWSAPVPAGDCEALQSILRAFARGTKRSRIRKFAGVCSKGHTLIEVFSTTAGDYALWPVQTAVPDPELKLGMRRGPVEWMAVGVDTADPEGIPGAHCRCTKSADFRFSDLAEVMSTGVSRSVVYPLRYS